MKERIEKPDFIKNEFVYHAKDTTKRTKRQSGRKYLQNTYWIKVSSKKTNKNNPQKTFLKLNRKKKLKIGPKTIINISPRKIYMSNKHMKIYFT